MTEAILYKHFNGEACIDESQWQHHLHSFKTFEGDKKYYYAILDEKSGINWFPEKTVSYRKYIEEIFKPSLDEKLSSLK